MPPVHLKLPTAPRTLQHPQHAPRRVYFVNTVTAAAASTRVSVRPTSSANAVRMGCGSASPRNAMPSFAQDPLRCSNLPLARWKIASRRASFVPRKKRPSRPPRVMWKHKICSFTTVSIPTAAAAPTVPVGRIIRVGTVRRISNVPAMKESSLVTLQNAPFAPWMPTMSSVLRSNRRIRVYAPIQMEEKHAGLARSFAATERYMRRRTARAKAMGYGIALMPNIFVRWKFVKRWREL